MRHPIHLLNDLVEVAESGTYTQSDLNLWWFAAFDKSPALQAMVRLQLSDFDKQPAKGTPLGT